jgi:hypothetical protein
VIYTVTTGFGSTQITKQVKISATPPIVTVTGPDTASLGVSSTAFHLIGTPSGGTFTSLDPSKVIFTTLHGDFVILHKGITLLTYSYTNACGMGMDTFVVYLPLPNNVNEFSNGNAGELNIYPNPNNGTFSLNMASSFNEQVHVVLTNMIGEAVYESNIATNKVSEMNTNIPAGIYMVTATSGHAKITRKVTITE